MSEAPSDPAQFTCQHEQCVWDPSSPAKFQATSERNLRKHHAEFSIHPCCTQEERCAKGKAVRKPTFGVLGKRKDTPFHCTHTSCKRPYANKKSLYNHMRKHQLCTSPCENCSPVSNQPSETPSVEQLIESLPTQRLEPCAVDTSVRALCDSNLQTAVVVNKSEEGKFHVVSLPEFCRTAVIPAFTNLYAWVADLLVTPDVPLAVGELLKDHIDIVFQLTQCTSYDDATKVLQSNKGFTEELFKLGGDRLLAQHLQVPSLAALLKMKDQLLISDNNWKVVEETFQLPIGARLYNIRKYRKSVTHTPKRTPGGNGYQYDLYEALKYALVLEKIPAGSQVDVKIGLDAGQAVKGKRKQVEAVTLEIVSGKSANQCKSMKNAYLVSVILPASGNNPETNSQLQHELNDFAKSIAQLLADPVVEFEIPSDNPSIMTKVSVTVRVFGCCDMKCLLEILGLKNLFKSTCNYRCPWCEINNDLIGDFSPDRHWPFRDIEVMQTRWNSKLSKLADSTRSNYASNPTKQFFGQVGRPILNLPLSRWITCELHCCMSMCKFLRNQFHGLIADSPAVCDEYISVLESLNIAVYSDTKKSSAISFLERMKKTRLSRPESLRILLNGSSVFKCLENPIMAPFSSKIRILKLLWHQLTCILAIVAESFAMMTEERWIIGLKNFALEFLKLAAPSDVTSYLHVLVYHVGYFLEQYEGIERFSNYSVEGTIKWLKSTIDRGITRGMENISRQCLERNQRMQSIWKNQNPSKTSETRAQKKWSQKITRSNDFNETFAKIFSISVEDAKKELEIKRQQ